MTFVLVGRTTGRTAVRGVLASCPCGRRVGEVMRAVGMTVIVPKTPDEWRVHMREEKEILYPALRRAVATTNAMWVDRVERAIARFEIDHALYGALLDAGRPLPTGTAPHSTDVHGREEDAIVWAHRGALGSGVQTAGAWGDARVAGGDLADRLAEDLRAAAQKDAAAAAARRTEVNDRLKAWGKEFAWAGGGTLILAGAAIVALDVIGGISKWFGGDPDSAEWQEYATNAFKTALLDGWMPRRFDGSLSFAKDYANATVAGNEQFDRWIGTGYDWKASWAIARTHPTVQSAAARAMTLLGPWYDASVDGLKSDPAHYNHLPVFVASVASVRYGIPLAEAIRIAMGTPVDTTHGIGAGWKFHRDAWVRLQAAAKKRGSAASGFGTLAVLGGIAYGVWRWIL